eukprot:3755287-Rhodomonas_salina.2
MDTAGIHSLHCALATSLLSASLRSSFKSVSVTTLLVLLAQNFATIAFRQPTTNFGWYCGLREKP